jgi:predicted alpha/beta hydrolase family esterase
MKTDVLFVQGGGKNAHEEDQKLAASLQAALGSDYDVQFPRMPKESNPEYLSWKTEIGRRLDRLRGEPLLVGHSVGGAMLLKYLSETKVDGPVAGLFLLAAPFIGADEKWQDDAAQIDFSNISEMPRTFLYHCHDDEIVPFSHLALYCGKVPSAKVRAFRNGGHQFRNRMAEIALDIKNLKEEGRVTQ